MATQYDPITPVNNYATQTAASLGSSVPTGLSTGKYVNTIPYNLPYQNSNVAGNLFSLLGSGLAMSGNPILGLVGSLGGNLVNFLISQKNNRDQQAWQKEFYDYTFNKQREEYWKQQFYNSPVSQMARLEAAGLNPNLVYGANGASAAGNAQSLNPAGESGRYTPSVPYLDATNLMTPMIALSQMMLNQANTAKALEDAGVSRETAVRIGLLTPYEQQKLNREIMMLDEQMDKTANEIWNLRVDAQTKTIFRGIARKFYEAQIRQMKANAYQMNQAGDLSVIQMNKVMAEIEQVVPAMANMYNASAEERWKAAWQIAELTPQQKREIAAKADLTETQLDNYIWTDVVPTYVRAGIDVAGMAATRGLSMLPQTTTYYDASGTPYGATTTRRNFR